MGLKNYESELTARLRKTLKPYASEIRTFLAEDERLRHEAYRYNSENAEDLYESLRGTVVATGGTPESIAELMQWGAFDLRLTKGIYGTISDLLGVAREHNGGKFRSTAVAAAEACLVVVDAIAAEAQKQWDAICRDAGEPPTTATFVADRCAGLKDAFHSIIADDTRFGAGTFAEFLD